MSAVAVEAAAGGVVIVQAWCPVCRELVLPMDDGRCCWCDARTGGAQAAPLAVAVAAGAGGYRWARAGDPEHGPVCLYCGGPKSPSARQCMGCRRANGWRGRAGPGRQRPRCISEELLVEARVLYASGLSLRQVAARVFPRTTYRSEQSCRECLRGLFLRRGWTLRAQPDVTAARNFRHGRAPREGRDDGAYRRWLKATRGLYRPQCIGVKRQAPGAGRRCRRTAMAGSDYCHSHAPERERERLGHMAAMRARIGAEAAL